MPVQEPERPENFVLPKSSREIEVWVKCFLMKDKDLWAAHQTCGDTVDFFKIAFLKMACRAYDKENVVGK